MSFLSGQDIGLDASAPGRATTPLRWAWLVILAIIGSDVVGLRWMHESAAIVGGLRFPVAILALSGVAAVLAWRVRTNRDTSEWSSRFADMSFTVQWMVAFVAFCVAAVLLSYLSVAAGFPLIDGQLVRIDEAIGFDWIGWYRWVSHHRAISVVLSVAYATGLVQTMVVPLILGLTGRRSEMVRHITRMMAATLLAIAISTPFPAASAFLHFHIADPGTASTVSSFFPLREGTLRVIDLSDMQGLVSMPSMHVTMAILFTWALRRVPRLAVPVAVLNAVMIVSTPSQGGHYLLDLVMGAALAWAMIRIVPDNERVV